MKVGGGEPSTKIYKSLKFSIRKIKTRKAELLLFLLSNMSQERSYDVYYIYWCRQEWENHDCQRWK